MSIQDKLAALKAKKEGIVLKQKEEIETKKSQGSIGISNVRGNLDLLKRQTTPTQFYFDKSSNKVRLVVMLDISGSMQGTEGDIYEGLSELIDNHKDDDILVTLVVFNGNIQTIYRDMPIEKVKPHIITASGMTNLNGAIYDAVSSYIGCSDMQNLFITISDGDDTVNNYNNLQSITASRVLSLINEMSGCGDLFYFLGEADEQFMKPKDVLLRAKELGFKDSHISIFTREYSGNRINLQVISDMLDDLLEKGEVRANWDEPIRENYLRLTSGRR